MKRYALALAHAFLGWILCAATMGTAMAVTTEANALIIHLIAVPFLAVGITMFYRRQPSPLGPIAWAALLLGVIASMDALVVAGLILGSFEMFGSLIGIWIPFALLFVCSTVTGWLMDSSRARLLAEAPAHSSE